ncbi:MAG: hypothetical protein H0W30_17740 [Gemmatimonadaceae bacterium]|nr:hypothetical protein [Gemmatimonadaceae bacterium]
MRILAETRWRSFGPRQRLLLTTLGVGLVSLIGASADDLAHGVAAGDKGYLHEVSGFLLIPFAYLDANT